MVVRRTKSAWCLGALAGLGLGLWLAPTSQAQEGAGVREAELVQHQTAQLEAARSCFNHAANRLRHGAGEAETSARWSERVRSLEAAQAEDAAGVLAAARAHLERMDALVESLAKAKEMGGATQFEVDTARYHQATAQIRVAQAKAKPSGE